MGQVEQKPTTELILAAVEHRRDDLADAMLSEITSGIDEYQLEQDSAGFWSDVREHCARHVDEIMRSARSGGIPDPGDLEFARTAARRRYDQGLSLDAFLRAFRIGLRVIWNAVLEQAERLEDRAAAIDLALPLMRYLDLMSSCVAEAYLSRRKLSESVADQADRDLLELLLAGDERARELTAGQGDLRPDAEHIVLVATLAEKSDPEAYRDLSDQLKLIFGSEQILVAPRHDEVVLIFSEDRFDEETLTDRLDNLRLTNGTVPVHRVGVGTPSSSLDGIPEAHRQAQSALTLTNAGCPVVSLARLPVLDYMLAREDSLARTLVPPAIRELATSKVPMDRILVQTLFAYMAANMNVQRTSSALPAHVNTVHYRLNRLDERTGFNHRNLEQMVELTVALRLSRPSES